MIEEENEIVIDISSSSNINASISGNSNINSNINSDNSITPSISSSNGVNTEIEGKGPQGPKGADGITWIPEIEEVNTIEYNEEASASVRTLLNKMLFIFNIPRGSPGDMSKSVYDTDDNGIVDNAEKVNNHTVEADVPQDALFTDTTYEDVSEFNNDVGYLSSETDPIFSASAASGITNTDITNWNNKSDFSGSYNDLTDIPTTVQNTLVENTSGQTLHLPMVSSTGTGKKNFFNTTGLSIYHKQGTTSATGRSELVLGTNIASGTAGNKNGQIRLFGNNTGSTYIVNTNTNTSNCTINVPAKNGILALEGVSLYDNSSGTTGTVTLSESASNFNYLEIFFRNNDNTYSSVKVYSPNNKRVSLFSVYLNTTSSSGEYFMAKGANVTISGTSITKNSYCEGNFYNQNQQRDRNNNTYILKVLGYK